MKYIKEYKKIDWDNWDEEEFEPTFTELTDKLFVEFLKDHDILNQFTHNMGNSSTNQHYTKYWSTESEFCYQIKRRRYIIDAFKWSNTMEDEKFWGIINLKWGRYLKSKR